MLSETDLDRIKNPALFHYWTMDLVRFSDLDPNNHVNNVVILSYVETARIGFRNAILDGMKDKSRDMSWVVVSQSIAYFKPISHPSEINVGCFQTDLGRTSFQLAYGIFVNDVCHASAISRSVCIDPKTKKPIALTNNFRSRLEEFHSNIA